ncbi:mechanosensitive ion channel family protein [Tianweitania sediminis]|uniref:Mechanosensitive ion channel n=1 Tax=Tianweitania sediminis TaxID=1502156 RepID=A0A8J7R2V2_9HYPH|nr:mechanosensitive ion channel domain-containing protein [Tianweitania sediminis]MBP0441005.1 mechanosensitive ion channel [Tianweitania sediminis]
MPSELEQLGDALAREAQRWAGATDLTWLLVQAGVLVLLFLLAKLIATRIEPSLDERARRIRHQRGLLRMIAALLRRLHWPIFIALLFLAITAIRAFSLRQTVLLSLALALAAAWFVTVVLSRIIRNRLAAKAVSWCVWILVALLILGLLDDAAVLLDRVALPLGATRLSLLTVLKTLALLGAAVWIASIAGSFVDRKLRTTEGLTPSMQVLLGKIFKVGLIVVAVLLAVSAAGLDLTTLTIFSGAIGVGLGFGLQKVVSNFISGIIILMDRSIKPGDTITVGETFGWIRELRARFVSVVTRDGREYLIPNEDFITERVVNWSFTDELVRLDITFGVSYNSDPHLVTKVAIEAASGVARVEADRRPVCWITGFGDSSIDFLLRFWIHDPQQGLTNVRGKVYLALWDAFKANNIEIPFPVRDVILRSPPVGTKVFDLDADGDQPLRPAPSSSQSPSGR